jgi:hypothetical protein
MVRIALTGTVSAMSTLIFFAFVAVATRKKLMADVTVRATDLSAAAIFSRVLNP